MVLESILAVVECGLYQNGFDDGVDRLIDSREGHWNSFVVPGSLAYHLVVG